MSWGAIAHQCSCTHKESFLFPIHRETTEPSDIPVIQRLRTKMPYTASSELWMSPYVPPSKVLCPKWWQNTQENTSLWTMMFPLYLKKSMLWPELQFSYRKIKFVRWWGLLSFAFRNSALTYHCKWPWNELEDRICFNSVSSGTTICITTNCQSLNMGYLGFLTITVNKGMICTLQLWPL